MRNSSSSNSIATLFADNVVIRRIQERLPALFYTAEQQSCRGGKIGMEVGSLRERILIALLIYKFGPENIDTNFPIAAPEIDVGVFGYPLSIKTVTGAKLAGVKMIWTVDAEQALKFAQEYIPRSDILFVQINWENRGGVFLFPLSAQEETLKQIGREMYIKLPKPGTNPRGVEISKQAVELLAKHPETKVIPIEWRREEVEYDPYEQWLELWRKD